MSYVKYILKIHIIQFRCCGVDGPKDWIDIVNPDPSKDKNLPMSCCEPEFGIVGNKQCRLDETNNTDKVYQTGCGTAFGDFVRAHAVSLGAAGIILAFIQVSHSTFDSI